MHSIDHTHVTLQGGYLAEKEALNRGTTIHAVYQQFEESGRIAAFACDWREGQENRPHLYWDSDVAKWMEGAAYILKKHPEDTVLEARLDALIEQIRCHQGADGYFNIYFTAVEPARRFRDRNNHELYCAGHLIEAAIACAEIGKTTLLSCMERYVSYIHRVFVEEKSAAFATPGHEEIELALLRLYRYTGEGRYLELARYFLDVRGTAADVAPNAYNQSHAPVREQREAVGHAVRAVYLYTAMAMLAHDTGDAALWEACRTLYADVVEKKMYVTGGIGSTYIGEAFTAPYDLPNDTAYAETCAAIGMMFFCRAMAENEPDARYADCIERAFYNGVLAGLSLDGERFFYENALQIDLREHFSNAYGAPRFPITQRPPVFSCSCCPPNLNRLLSSLGGYLYGWEEKEETLYVHQYAASTLDTGHLLCTVETDYPRNGQIRITARGAARLALRIPGWCQHFTLDRPYTMQKGYALIENDGKPVTLSLVIEPQAVFASSHVARDAYQLCVMRGPVVYCAEAVDNGAELHRFSLSPQFQWQLQDAVGGLPALTVSAFRLSDAPALYSTALPTREATPLRLIPYSAFANRGESDMRVWFPAALA